MTMPLQGEFEIDEATASEIIREQFPDLSIETIDPFGVGWDNVVFIINDDILFRFPRRRVAIGGVSREITFLPELANILSPIPNPIYVGKPRSAFPYPFFGYQRLEGNELCSVSVDRNDRRALASSLGEFLRTLHDVSTYERIGGELPLDPIGRLDLQTRIPKTRKQLGRIEKIAPDLPCQSLHAIADQSLSIELPRLERVVHGDLHFRHILVDSDLTLTGVIDWGDLARNDPALDLQVYWSMFAATDRPAFVESYGPIPPGRLALARLVALYLNANLLEYALAERLPNVAEEARWALAQTCRPELYKTPRMP